MKYKRVLLKLSGGALSKDERHGYTKEALEHIADEIISAVNAGIEVAVVVGGGNLFRGRVADEWHIERAEADNIGMLATIMNSLMLRGALAAKGLEKVRVMTAIPINTVAEPYIRLKALKHLEHGKVVIFGGGIGNPYVTTDYPSIQRAIEIRADVVLMAKEGVKGIYTDNPKDHPDAKRYKTVSYDEVIKNKLQVADQSAFILARDYKMPMYVFDFDEKDAVARLCSGENIGTYVGEDCDTEMYED